MHRVVSLYLPTWPTDRLRRQGGPAPQPDEPLVTVINEGSRRVLAAVDDAARALGLHPGQTLAHARTIVPDLVVRPADPSGETDGLVRLALWCVRHASPIASPDPPDSLLVDATGCAHLHGGEEAMLDRLVAGLGRMGIVARAALADTPGAARAFARWRPEPVTIAPPGGHRALLAPLPVAALDLEADTTADLRRLGFETIGRLSALPRAALASRFGPQILRRLDQVFGDRHEPIIPVIPEDMIQVRRTFVEPIATAEVFARVIADLTEDLCRVLEKKGFGARRLDLLFHGVDSRIQAVSIGTSRPSREPRRLARLLGERLDRVDPGFGIETMTLAVPLSEPFAADQKAAAFGAEEADPDLSALVDTLMNRLGPGRLYRATPVESDVPERSVRHVSPLAEEPASASIAWPYAGERPIRIFTPPEPIDVIGALPDYPPKLFIWRGRRHRVAQADGPERIHGEWWKTSAETFAVRDYFRVEDEAGQRFWLFRRGDGENPATGSMRWFLHGLFA